MNIQATPFNINYTAFLGNQSTVRFFRNNEIKDTVSFTGKNEPPVITPNMENALQTGLDLYKMAQTGSFSIKDVQELAQKNIPIIKIDSVNNIPQIQKSSERRYLAYMEPKYNNLGIIDSLTMYLPDNMKSVSELSSFVHEYTHALQRYNDDTYIGAFTILGEKNINHARGISTMGGKMLNELDMTKDSRDIKKFKQAVKTSKRGKPQKEALAMAYGYKNVEDMKKGISKNFDTIYPKFLKGVMSTEENKAFVPYQDDKEKLKDAVKKMCRNFAQREYEAYETQRMFIKQADKHSLTDENIMNPVYFKIVEEALA